jgi:outer membrane protein TolC
LIAVAQSANLDVKAALARVVQARANYGIVAADGLPQLTLHDSSTRSQSSIAQSARIPGIAIPQTTENVFRTTFDASWEIDLFGRIARSREASQADLDASLADVDDARLTLLGDVARNYVSLRGTQARLALTDANVLSLRDTLHLTEVRFTGGLSAADDVSRAESQLRSQEALAPPLRSQVRSDLANSAVLLATTPTSLAWLEQPGGKPPDSVVDIDPRRAG